ncbi:hypothetical protein [Cereibacter sphaeroides]|uniref:hypothetical protein n=1 Tax=Cereibacter sphaeroides TaxID=1063 RepID=UPI000F53B3F1|nr:hypothetical protein [Cereibacter sphaeroides]AZB70276.1 hypothetical protein EBL86_17920 [Cereibacter sphaeroides]
MTNRETSSAGEAETNGKTFDTNAVRDDAVMGVVLRVWNPTAAGMLTLAGLAGWLVSNLATNDIDERVRAVIAGALQVDLGAFICLTSGAAAVATLGAFVEMQKHPRNERAVGFDRLLAKWSPYGSLFICFFSMVIFAVSIYITASGVLILRNKIEALM